MRSNRHSHPCARCGTKTECGGELERNVDGFPEVICSDFHLAGGQTNAAFLCEDCAAALDVAEILDEA